MSNNIYAQPLYHPCTGCQMCAVVCPRKAIYIQKNGEGFYRPEVKEDLCVSCGICREICYKCVKDVAIEMKDANIIAAQVRNQQLLKESTSGGVAGVLAKELLKQGYQVIGVGYDYDNDIAVDKVVSTHSELIEFRGSKYMQSLTQDAFTRAVENKRQKIAVFGTPCHIYAMGEWALKAGERDRFLFVDMFCHGCPSLKLWEKYVELYKKKMKVGRFDKIVFRSKKYGWHEFAHTFYSGGKAESSKRTMNDPFFTIFFDDCILNDACYECSLRSSFIHTDIRLGDFWGERYDMNQEGVSAVVILSEKGREVIKTIMPFINTKSSILIEEVVKAQSYGKIYYLDEQMRNRTFYLLNNYEMDDAYKMYLIEYPLKKKLRRTIKKIVNFLPSRMRMKIKKIYHAK